MIQDPIAPETEETVLHFLETAAAFEREIDRAFSNARGISFSEYRLLLSLSKASAGGLPRIDLADAVGLTASAVTRALQPLEKLGYVATEKGERDARQSLARITPAGRQLLEDVQVVFQDILRALPLNTLSPKKVAEFRSRLADFKSK